MGGERRMEVRKLGKRFGSRWIFRSINFEIGVGDVLVVLGRNGSGKSTLLRTVSGLIPASEGDVLMPTEDRRASLGLSALDLAVYPQLSCREHLEFSGSLRGVNPNALAILERVGLGDAVERAAGQLSTGMRSRLKLAMAIQHEPAVLMLDEPGAALDSDGRKLLEAIVDEQRARGALILATNDPAERRFATLELELAN